MYTIKQFNVFIIMFQKMKLLGTSGRFIDYSAKGLSPLRQRAIASSSLLRLPRPPLLPAEYHLRTRCQLHARTRTCKPAMSFL